MDLKKILPKKGPPIEEVTKYIEKYKNELIVIKYGGNVFIDRVIFNNFIDDICLLNKLGLSIVIVHGGGPRIKRELDKSNIQTRFIKGLRVTDKKIINMQAERRIYLDTGMPTTEAAIYRNFFNHLYIVMGQQQPMNSGKRIIRVYFNPLIVLIWSGSFLMACGGLISILDRKRKKGIV